MKLCPLLESVGFPEPVSPEQDAACRLLINRINAALPQEAIRYALECMEDAENEIMEKLNYYHNYAPKRELWENNLVRHKKRANQLHALLTDEGAG
jgi:hypothetical protein